MLSTPSIGNTYPHHSPGEMLKSKVFFTLYALIFSDVHLSKGNIIDLQAVMGGKSEIPEIKEEPPDDTLNSGNISGHQTFQVFKSDIQCLRKSILTLFPLFLYFCRL